MPKQRLPETRMAIVQVTEDGRRLCTADGCDHTAAPRGLLCSMHYRRRQHHQTLDLLPRPMTDLQHIVLHDDGSASIPLYRHEWGDTVSGAALIDQADIDWARQWRWHRALKYVARFTKSDGQRQVIFLHRELMAAPPFTPGGLQVDHVNRDRMDNRRENLRIVPASGNAQNVTPRVGGTSRYRGVYLKQQTGRWVAQAKVGGVNHWLGTYEDEETASMVAAEWRLANMPGAVD